MIFAKLDIMIEPLNYEKEIASNVFISISKDSTIRIFVVFLDHYSSVIPV